MEVEEQETINSNVNKETEVAEMDKTGDVKKVVEESEEVEIRSKEHDRETIERLSVVSQRLQQFEKASKIIEEQERERRHQHEIGKGRKRVDSPKEGKVVDKVKRTEAAPMQHVEFNLEEGESTIIQPKEQKSQAEDHQSLTSTIDTIPKKQHSNEPTKPPAECNDAASMGQAKVKLEKEHKSQPEDHQSQLSTINIILKPPHSNEPTKPTEECHESESMGHAEVKIKEAYIIDEADEHKRQAEYHQSQTSTIDITPKELHANEPTKPPKEYNEASSMVYAEVKLKEKLCTIVQPTEHKSEAEDHQSQTSTIDTIPEKLHVNEPTKPPEECHEAESVGHADVKIEEKIYIIDEPDEHKRQAGDHQSQMSTINTILKQQHSNEPTKPPEECHVAASVGHAEDKLKEEIRVTGQPEEHKSQAEDRQSQTSIIDTIPKKYHSNEPTKPPEECHEPESMEHAEVKVEEKESTMDQPAEQEIQAEDHQHQTPINDTIPKQQSSNEPPKILEESASVSGLKTAGAEYPEDLNPFASDDDADNDEEDTNNNYQAKEENVQLRGKITSTKRESLNPFDSSDDEIELEKPLYRKSITMTSPNTPNSATKIKPPRPPPPRISLNPFGSEEAIGEGDNNANFARRTSLTSSASRKAPVPTPRSNRSGNPTPEPTPRLSHRTPSQQYALQSSNDYYGSENSLMQTPQHMPRNSDFRGSNNSLTSSSGGTVRSRKNRRAPAPPTQSTVKELFPSNETIDQTNSPASTPSSSTMGTPKLGRKKRPAPAPPKPARVDAENSELGALATTNGKTGSKNLFSYPLQSELESKLSDEEKALLEGKKEVSQAIGISEAAGARQRQGEGNIDNAEELSCSPGGRKVIPLDASLLKDHSPGGESLSRSDDSKLKANGARAFATEGEGSDVVYRRVIVPTNLKSPVHESNSLLAYLATDSRYSRQLEKLKDNKEAKNRIRQSQLSGGGGSSSGSEENDGSFTYNNQSSQSKLKKRKGPAPGLPIPPRKVLQMLPLQEIIHELEIIEVQQQGLEKQGVILEKMIRDRCEGQDEELDTKKVMTEEGATALSDIADGKAKERMGKNSKEVEDLILQLFELVNEKNELFRRQAELMSLRRQHRLEQEQADLEYEIRVLMAQPERNKTDTNKAKEEALIARLVDVVQMRNDVIESLEMDRLREVEEDLSIKLHLEAKREAADDKKSFANISKKEKKKAKKLSKNRKVDVDKDADESELSTQQQKFKKKKKFLFLS